MEVVLPMSRLFHYGLIKRAVCHLGICLVPFRNSDLFLKPFEKTNLDYIVKNKTKTNVEVKLLTIKSVAHLNFCFSALDMNLKSAELMNMSHATWFAWLFFAY